MSRSHIANMHSISSLPSINNNQELSTPRSIPSPAYGSGACTPPLLSSNNINYNDRPRDSGVQAIGNIFTNSYDSDFDSDAEELSSPPPTKLINNHHNNYNEEISKRTTRTRAMSVAVNHQNQNQEKKFKNVLEAKIKSQAGELDNWDSDQEGDYLNDEEDLQPPKSPNKRNDLISRQSDESGRVRPLTVVEFPEPTLQPDQGHGRGYPQVTNPLNPQRPNGPLRSNSDNPHNPDPTGYPRIPPPGSNTSPSPSLSHPQPQLNNNTLRPLQLNTSSSILSPPRTIILPPPSSPISPLLAAPPQSHFSPLSPPSSAFSNGGSSGNGHGRSDSSSNGSIRGFDIMSEKKALFREGQEELISPFSTRRNKPGRSKMNGQQTKSTFLVSGMDFWKRFSVHVKLDEQEKANTQTANGSAWLSKAKERNGRIKKMVWVFLVLLIILVGGLIAYFVTRPTPPPKSIATSI